MFIPLEDGITHINVYSRGSTEIGRLLSNFAYSPFVHPEYGKFNSVEGFWFWLKTEDDELRNLHGFKAKKYGKEQIEIYGEIHRSDFQEQIIIAIDEKLVQNPEIYKKLCLTNEPLTHYYYYGSIESPTIKDAGGQFILDELDRMRRLGKELNLI